ncbi:MAG: A/G-specific adenine glycosylase [Planctomycetota bacterium]|nr:A/G-specific adenine glycosylase [Planctomycetota bacterium]
MDDAGVSSEWVARFRRSVRRWYSRSGRELPWVGERDPYRVWVREIMLQQTTVKAVVPFLERFLDRFPSVEQLAGADDEDVLRVWEGLGYYSRARNLQKAARKVVDEWGGVWPTSLVELESLPGVGRYTAGAIVSFAFGEPGPIVEANTSRLYSRLMAMALDPTGAAGRKRLWSLAERIVPKARPGEFNQALIDLGATVCTTEPRCNVCPVRMSCRAVELGEVENIPVKKARRTPTELHELILVVRRKDEVFLVQHPPGERWGGLWGFPRLRRDSVLGLEPSDSQGVVDEVSLLGWTVEFAGWYEAFRHSVTRFRLNLQPVDLRWSDGEWGGAPAGEWVSVDELDGRPMSVAERRVAAEAAGVLD